MSVINKSYRNNQNGDIIRIVDSYQNIAITDTKEKISTDRLLDSRYYTEYIDPKSFFNDSSTYNLFAEKIKSVDLSTIPEDNINITSPSVPGFEPATNESAVTFVSEEDEIEELKRKYGATLQDPSALKKQNDALNKIINPEEIIEDQLVTKSSRVESKLENKVESNTIQRVVVEDPIITMFKSVKRNVDFKFSFDIDGKIPRIDFIEMMEDSYDTSIIKYLAEDFTQKILNNPDIIRDKIISEIKSMVDNKIKSVDTKSKVVKPKTTPKPKTTTKRPTKSTKREGVDDTGDLS
jgi:hypothetical protein